jgi:dihydroorotate dehydrogenase electron transfer subunit
MSEGIHRVVRVVEAWREGTAGVTLITDGALPAEPGQFAMIWLPGVEERPYTIVDGDPLAFTVAEVGPFSAAMAALAPGDRLWVRGPYGHGFRLAGRRHLLIGGGSGAASLAPLARRARARGDDVTVVLGARSADLLMLAWLFEREGLPPLLATDDGSAGFHGTALDAAAGALAGRPDAVYACGPEPMLRAVAERTRDLRIPCQVSLERVMRCGLGVCGQCHCGDRLVCTDGPVFTGDVYLEAVE